MKTGACPVCGDGLGKLGLTACEACHVPHHAECFAYNGRCAVYGCRGKKGVEAGTAAGCAELLIIEDAPEDRLPDKMFFPVPAQAPVRRIAMWLSMAIAACVVVTAAVRGSPRAALVMLVATALAALSVGRRRLLQAAVLGQSWEIDRAAGELALLTRTPGRVARERVAKLDAIEYVVVEREDVVAIGESYRSAWRLCIELKSRRIALTEPVWTDGHLEPAKQTWSAAKDLARGVEKDVVLDPPHQGRLPARLGRFPSQPG